MIKSKPFKFHGGKSYLQKWIHSLAPPSVINDPESGYTHRNIACAGGLGEFWNWMPVDGISETVNDASVELINFWSTLSSTKLAPEFMRRASVMPLSDVYFNVSKLAKDCGADSAMDTYDANRVAAALGFFIRYRQSRQGLGKDYATPTTRVRRGMNENVSAWLSAVDGLPECHKRLRRVEIRNMDAVDFIKAYDHPRALFYLDPPYIHETRSSNGEYGPHEMTAEQHQGLLDCLSQIDGKFMLSGYKSSMYHSHAICEDWVRHEKTIDNKASSSKTKPVKTECLWTNYSPIACLA